MVTGRQPKKSALIVAIDTYEDPGLKQLRAPGHDANALADVLGHPEIGGFDVSVALNENSGSVSRALERFFSNRLRDDVLLVHFSCHGIKDAAGRLFFAASDTDRTLLQTTAVSAELVNEFITNCRSRNIVLLLDCCYSGAFTREMLARNDGSVDVVERFPGNGRAVLTASSALEYAFEGDNVSGRGMPSVFTSAVVRGLKTGEADHDGDDWVSIDELYDYVYDEVRRQTPNQTPIKSSTVQGRLLVAKSARPRPPAPTEIPAALVESVNGTDVEARLAAIPELAVLARGRHPDVVSKARALLADLVKDDSRRVSIAAHAALDETELTSVQSRVQPVTPKTPSVPVLPPAPALEGSPAAVAPKATDNRPSVIETARVGRGRLQARRDDGGAPRHESRHMVRRTRSWLTRPRRAQIFGMRLTTNALAALGVTMAVIAVPLGSGYVGGVRTFWERISDQPAAPSTSDPEATPLPSPAPAEAASPVPMTSPTAALPPPQQLTVQRRGETRWAESVYSAAFSPDGSRIAFVSKGGLLLLWDPTRGTSTSVNPQSLRVLHAKDSDLTSVDWGTDPTAPRILTTANDGHAVLWTSTVGTWSGQTVDLRDGRPALWGGVLSYDGSRIATVGADGIAKVIGLKPPSAVNIRVGSQGWSVAFSKDGTRVVTGGEGGAAPLKLWSVDGGEPLWASDSIPNVWVREVAIDPTGTLIAAASHDGQVRLWRNLTDPFIVLPGHSDQPAQSVAFNSDGSLIASAGDDGIVRVFDSATAASVATIPPVDQDKRIHSVRFSRQGRRLVIAGNSGWVRLYELLPAAAPADSPTPVGPGIPTRPSNQK